MSNEQPSNADRGSLGTIGLEELQALTKKAGASDKKLGKAFLKKLRNRGEGFKAQGWFSSDAEEVGGLVRHVANTEGLPEALICVAVWSSKSRFPCSGILWKSDVVVTTGHTEAIGYREYVTTETGTKYEVKECHSHPKFAGSPYFQSDVSLLFLEKGIRDVMQFPLIATDKELKKPGAGIVMGFGRRRSGVYYERKVMDVERLLSKPNPPKKPSGEPVLYDKDNELVAVPKRGSEDACEGDSGGPLFIQRRGHGLVLAGMVSRDAGMYYEPCGGGTIYVRLDGFKDWIEDTIRQVRPEEGH